MNRERERSQIFIYIIVTLTVQQQFIDFVVLSLIGIISFDPPLFKPCVIAATGGKWPIAISDLA